jgi:hypothetical protein
MTSIRAAIAFAAALSIAAPSIHAQAKVDVTGKWAVTVETDQGSGTPTITLKQDGEKLTGHYTGQFGEADLTGSVKGQTIEFSFTVDVQGNQLKEIYSGTVESKDSIKGKVDLSGLATGTFTAKRQ